MSDAPATPARSVAVEIRKEQDWDASGRLLGVFSVQVDFGDGFDEHEAEGLAPLAGDQADPHRGLSIEKAIATGRSLADRVTVYLGFGRDAWDASAPPQPDAERSWPPPELHLRPRWHFESPFAAPAEAWDVQFTLSGAGITPAVALAAASRAPNLLEATVVEPAPDAPDRRPDQIIVRCLVAASEDHPADGTREISHALGEALPRAAARGEVGVGVSWPRPAARPATQDRS